MSQGPLPSKRSLCYRMDEKLGDIVPGTEAQTPGHSTYTRTQNSHTMETKVEWSLP